MVVLLVVLTIIVFLTIEAVYHYAAKRKHASVPATVPSGAQDVLLEELFEPEGLYYNPSHVWAFLEMNGKVKLGLDHFFHQIVGKIDKIIVPDPGKRIERNSETIIIQSGDRTVQARIPVGGRIEAVNKDVLANPELLLSDAYKNGWILQMEPIRFTETIAEMKFGKDARTWLANEITKLKDLLSAHLSAEEPALRTMYDGGVPVQGLKSFLSDEEWSKVKREFFSDEAA